MTLSVPTYDKNKIYDKKRVPDKTAIASTVSLTNIYININKTMLDSMLFLKLKKLIIVTISSEVYEFHKQVYPKKKFIQQI